MSGAERARVRIDPALYSEIKKLAASERVDPAVTIDRLLNSALKTYTDRAGRIADMKTDSQLNRIDAITGKIDRALGEISALTGRIAKDIPATLQKRFAALEDLVSRTGNTHHLRDLMKSEFALFQGDLARRLKAIEGRIDQSADHAKTRHEIARLRADDDQKKRFFGYGAAATFAALFALAFLLADTPPTRWLATRLTGNSNQLMAGYALMGDGRDRGVQLLQTKLLLDHSQPFRTSYTRCLETAEKAGQSFPCKIMMMPVPKGPAE